MKRDRKIEAVVAYRLSGHSIRETAERFGLKCSTIKGYCNKAGVCAGYAKVGPIKPFNEREADAIKQIEEANAGVEYVGGYAGSEERVKVRCKTCGSVFTLAMSKFRGPTKSSKCCKICDMAYVRNTLVINTYMRSWESDEKERIKKETPKPKKEPKNKCAVCGRLTTRKKYCSVECSNKANNAARDLKKRMFAKSKIVDKDITLQKLYLRDKGICWICGMMCDYSDYRRTEKAFIAGELYPSKDHVVPRFKGGEHSWKNVRLAHMKCNTDRGVKDWRKEHTQSYIAV